MCLKVRAIQTQGTISDFWLNQATLHKFTLNFEDYLKFESVSEVSFVLKKCLRTRVPL